MKTPWLPNTDNQLPREERKCGAFKLSAWPDGFWTIDFKRQRIGHCPHGQELDSLESAKATAEAVFRNLLADAISGFGEQP